MGSVNHTPLGRLEIPTRLKGIATGRMSVTIDPKQCSVRVYNAVLRALDTGICETRTGTVAEIMNSLDPMFDLDRIIVDKSGVYAKYVPHEHYEELRELTRKWAAMMKLVGIEGHYAKYYDGCWVHKDRRGLYMMQSDCCPAIRPRVIEDLMQTKWYPEIQDRRKEVTNLWRAKQLITKEMPLG